jgi:hypothetical protein
LDRFPEAQAVEDRPLMVVERRPGERFGVQIADRETVHGDEPLQRMARGKADGVI